ncbi:MAG: type II and III secretion system protein family protein [Desulfuromonadaceae bacterium]|nr:type II and III secretion system protein family protein [Desulfuromonadaceae bacterium]
MIGLGMLAAVMFVPFSTMCFAQTADQPVHKVNEPIELKVGGSKLILPTHSFSRVAVANPAIADVTPLSSKEFYIFGKSVGYTSVMAWGERGGRTEFNVIVNLDLSALKQKLFELYPHQQIEVYATETGIVLTGTVTGAEIVEQVIRLAQSYLPKLAEEEGDAELQEKGETGKSGQEMRITNLLKVGGIQQVMLEVKFAEVVRTSDKRLQAALAIDKLLGSDVIASAGVFGTAFAGPQSLLINWADMAENVFVQIDNVTAALDFLESEGLARTLAEPRLVTQSGQEASFLAGGQFPVPVAQDNNTITIEYKDFGVGLRFTPIVLSDGKISLRVAPTVSEIASTSAIPSGIQGAEFVVPSLSSRSLQSTVNLYDGQTLALAGLLQDNLREVVRKVPGLGDIPVLGALFRSSTYTQNKTDLLIAVTPHLVKPLKEGEIIMPGQYMKEPNWFEFYLEGRLEGRRYGKSALSEHAFNVNKPAPRKTGGLEGEFGHQPATAQ